MSEPVDRLLPRLDGVRARCNDRWMAKCPYHEDSSASLSVKREGDGRLLIHCFAGCNTGDVLSAVGLEFADLFVDSPGYHKPTKHRISSSDVLRIAAREFEVVVAGAVHIADGKPLTDEDWRRFWEAVKRANAVIGYSQ